MTLCSDMKVASFRAIVNVQITVGGIDTDEIQNGFQNRRERSHVSYLNTVGPEWAGGPSTFGTLFTRRSSVLSICRWLYTSI